MTPAPEGSGSRQGRKRRWTPVSALEFVGCDSCRMTLREYEALDEDVKVEFFDSEVECAWMLREPEHLSHAKPGARLAELAREIAMTRGSPIVCCGEAQLRLLDRDSGQVRVMYPDQTVFLRPEGADSANRLFVDVGEDAYPDVVLEVDNTRDTRRDKLVLYEEWGFPELWVEVPDSYAPSRPRGLRPELRIYVLEETGYLPSGVSRAFPGWSAPEIHRALNEPVISAATSAVLRRVGRALGVREGTGPDDDPLLGAHRAEARAESAREILRRRGIAVSAAFTARFAGGPAVTAEAAVEAAFAAGDEADFFDRLRGQAASET